ncbi:MAG: xanthine dehydrogenase family protein subunit M [Actinomycetota bacterium]|nr:xanthine dehydrogenase family protein subunit M [Actinomycetota bacterium]
MIPSAFDYQRPTSLDAALQALADNGDDAKLMAGGHSLLPLMKLRLAAPGVIIDIGRLDELNYIKEAGDRIAIGALTRHHAVETSDLLGREVPLLAHATGKVGDPQVRHRGTIGGSIAHGDPASDLPAVMLALEATFTVVGPDGERQIEADDFFEGFLETTLADNEILTEISVPKASGAGWSFQKFNRRAQDWAIVGVAAIHNGTTGVGLVNMGSAPVRAAATEEALASGASAAEAAAKAADGLDPPADLNASVEYRRHLAQVLVRRALEEAGVS